MGEGRGSTLYSSTSQENGCALSSSVETKTHLLQVSKKFLDGIEPYKVKILSKTVLETLRNLAS